MSTLPVVEEILRETQVPMSVRQIVEYAGSRLPTRSKTPDTVVARDLSMDIKKKGEASLFARTAPGRYTLREIYLRAQHEAARSQAVSAPQAADRADTGQPTARDPNANAAASAASRSDGGGDFAPTSVLSAAMREERAAPLPARKPTDAVEERKTVG